MFFWQKSRRGYYRIHAVVRFWSSKITENEEEGELCSIIVAIDDGATIKIAIADSITNPCIVRGMDNMDTNV